MSTELGGNTQWWAHLRQRPTPTSSRGLWPPSLHLPAGERACSVFDLLGTDPPERGELALSDEDLNRRAEAFGLTESTLGWLRAWGERFPELPQYLVDFVTDMGLHPDGPRFRSFETARELMTAGSSMAMLADNTALLAGRIDDAWLEHHRRSVEAFAALGLGPELLHHHLAVRAVGIREFAVESGADIAEAATLVAAVSCYDQFVASLYSGWLVGAERRARRLELERVRRVAASMSDTTLQLDTLAESGSSRPR